MPSRPYLLFGSVRLSFKIHANSITDSIHIYITSCILKHLIPTSVSLMDSVSLRSCTSYHCRIPYIPGKEFLFIKSRCVSCTFTEYLFFSHWGTIILTKVPTFDFLAGISTYMKPFLCCLSLNNFFLQCSSSDTDT